MKKFKLKLRTKRLLKSVLIWLNRYIRVFPKDYLIMWDLDSNRPTVLDFIPFNDYEMFYGADLDSDHLYCRYSNYISNENKGILVFNLATKKMVNHISLHYDNVYFRLFEGKIIELRRYNSNFGLYFIDSDELIIESKSDTFEVILFNKIYYLLVDKRIYLVSKEFKLTPTHDLSEFIEEFQIRDLSMTFVPIQNSFEGFARIGDLAAYNTNLVQFKLSTNFELISKPSELNISDYRNKFGMHGVGFPLVRYVDDQSKLYFSYFWGHHLLQFKTLKYWKRVQYNKNQ